MMFEPPLSPITHCRLVAGDLVSRRPKHWQLGATGSVSCTFVQNGHLDSCSQRERFNLNPCSFGHRRPIVACVSPPRGESLSDP